MKAFMIPYQGKIVKLPGKKNEYYRANTLVRLDELQKSKGNKIVLYDENYNYVCKGESTINANCKMR